ncbi:MAG: glycosyltransferase family 2 protein [Candidatus Omnitrophica bacterium]|nr:glycosyltransferase family 2 protein [Candidatus Omnitrophota bacterium]
MSRVPVTVVIIARNEERNIDDCLASVSGWANEILVVDDGSTDRTVELARRRGARVLQRRMVTEGSHRNWAYSQSANQWVFSLDADERLTPALCAEIDTVLGAGTTHTHFTVPRKNFLGSYWMRWGGQYPAAQVKLLMKDHFRWEDTGVHPRAEAGGTTCGHLKEFMLHYTYRDFTEALRKLNGQTTLEARKWFNVRATDKRKADGKMNLGCMLWRALDRFFRAYVGRQGWRDGFIGFMMAYQGSLYQVISYAKYWEMVNLNEQAPQG